MQKYMNALVLMGEFLGIVSLTILGLIAFIVLWPSEDEEKHEENCDGLHPLVLRKMDDHAFCVEVVHHRDRFTPNDVEFCEDYLEWLSQKEKNVEYCRGMKNTKVVDCSIIFKNRGCFPWSDIEACEDFLD